MQEPPIKFCPACRTQNHISAQFCQRCGAHYEGAPPPVGPPRSKQNSPLRFLAMFFAAVFVFIVLMQIVALMLPGKSHPQTAALTGSPDPRPTPSPTPVLSPAEHLAEAKKEMNDPYCKYGCEAARQRLSAIPANAKEHKEARKLSAALDERRKRGEVAQKRLEEIADAARRKSFARHAEEGLLSKGYDASVWVGGPENRTLRVTYVLMSRPLVYQLTNEHGFLELAEAQGFRKVIFADGYNWRWWYTYDEKARQWK